MLDPVQTYMHRCIELARLGAGSVAPNPMVGAVLVYKDRIIGEGYHRQYGQAHAEVNCINSIPKAEKALIPVSTLYVSLEPCSHYGKTPPCSNRIIQEGIRKVVVGCRDPFPQVDGKGLEKLKQAGIEVINGILETECKELNKKFFTFVIRQRPYIILKWAQTANGMIAGEGGKRIRISNEYTNRLVHQWRSQEAAIMVGTNTALADDPSLTNRLWSGKSPARMVLDRQLRLPETLALFDGSQETIVLNIIKEERRGSIQFVKINGEADMVDEILRITHQSQLQSILVEGGTQLLQSFIDKGVWDEARIITNQSLIIANGLPAPVMHQKEPERTEKLSTDTICYYTNQPVNQ